MVRYLNPLHPLSPCPPPLPSSHSRRTYTHTLTVWGENNRTVYHLLLWRLTFPFPIINKSIPRVPMKYHGYHHQHQQQQQPKQMQETYARLYSNRRLRKRIKKKQFKRRSNPRQERKNIEILMPPTAVYTSCTDVTSRWLRPSNSQTLCHD